MIGSRERTLTLTAADKAAAKAAPLGLQAVKDGI
jgi:hypothetical protein